MWDCLSERFQGYPERLELALGKGNIRQLWMTVGEFLDLKAQKDNSRIPEYRYFDPEDTTKEILWKIVMCTRNVIVCLDKTTNRVLATIGLMELFNLYVQCS